MIWNKELNDFFVLGRHLRINVFICSQHVKGLGPMLRGNLDVAILQPNYNVDARQELHKLYGGVMDRPTFNQFLDEVILDENLPGSTPQEPKKQVRVLVCRDFENTINPQIKYAHWSAYDPGEFRMLDPEYWKDQDNMLGSNDSDKKGGYEDICDELDDIQYLQDQKF